MNVTIEHPFCPYCSEVTNLYFRIINTLEPNIVKYQSDYQILISEIVW